MKRTAKLLALFVCILTLTLFAASLSTSASAAETESTSTGAATSSQKAITKCSVKVSLGSSVYSGLNKKLSFVVKDGTKTLEKGVDYTVSRTTVKNAGTYSVYVYGKGKYSGKIRKTVTVSPKSISSCSFQRYYTYTGLAGDYVPTITFVSGTEKITLTNGTDFEFVRNSGPKSETAVLGYGSYSYTIKGKGNFSGQVNKTITILRKNIKTCNIRTSYTYTGKAGEYVPVIKMTSGNKTIVLKNGRDFEFNRNNGPSFTGSILGCYNYSYTIKGKGNFSGQVDKTITVKPRDIGSCYFETSYEYTGKHADIVPVIRISEASNSYTLVNGRDFEFERLNGPPFANAILGCCSYTYSITGIGNFSGQVNKTITVTQKDISTCYIQKEYVYTGEPYDIVPVIKVSADADSAVLVNGKDFEFKRTSGARYPGEVLGAGEHSYRITGKGCFSGEINTTITVLPVEIPESDIRIVKSDKIGFLDKNTGKIRNAVSVSVNFGGKTRYLTNGSGYKVTYADKGNKVIATVSLSGIYKGTKSSEPFSYTEPVFVWGRDDFQFSNGANSTGVNYSVSDSILDKMADLFKLTDDEIKKLKDYIKMKNQYDMQGRCNGMASTTILSKMGFLKFSDIDSRFSDTPFENPEDYDFISIINFFQGGSNMDCRKLENFGYSDDQVIVDQGYYISKIFKELETNNSMLKLYTSTTSSMHAIVAYGVEPFEYHSYRTGLDYNYRILIYDSNSSVRKGDELYNETCIYVYKPAQDYYWEYRYEFSSGTYWNSFYDHSNNWVGICEAYKYLSLTDETDILNDKTLIIGDANMDGKITISDATFIQNYLAGNITIEDEAQLIAADAYHDGVINIKDVTYIKKKLAGLAG